MTDAPRRYIEFCKTRINPGFNLGGLKLVIDCANGATYHIAPNVFEELGAEVIPIGIQPDGFNINQECGATHTENLRQKVIETGADVGIAFDGDGDRVVMIDRKGGTVDGDDILFVIASAKYSSLNGAVVGTVMSNLGLEQAIRELGLDFIRANVGDRYIMEFLYRDNLVLGGETSGHIINLNKTTTGDGIVTALQVLEIMLAQDKMLDELTRGLHKYPQVLINIKVQKQIDPFALKGIPQLVKRAEDELGRNGRILIRTSGTEPLIRVMVEGQDETGVNDLARQLASNIETAIEQAA